MIHGSPPPGTVRIGFAVPTYGPVTGVIVVNFTIVPGSAPAGADAPSTGTTLTRATPSAASSHLILLIFCLLLREPRQRSAGPGGPHISPFPTSRRRARFSVPGAILRCTAQLVRRGADGTLDTAAPESTRTRNEPALLGPAWRRLSGPYLRSCWQVGN